MVNEKFNSKPGNIGRSEEIVLNLLFFSSEMELYGGVWF
jgi:hypothetical protein